MRIETLHVWPDGTKHRLDDDCPCMPEIHARDCMGGWVVLHGGLPSEAASPDTAGTARRRKWEAPV